MAAEGTVGAALARFTVEDDAESRLKRAHAESQKKYHNKKKAQEEESQLELRTLRMSVSQATQTLSSALNASSRQSGCADPLRGVGGPFGFGPSNGPEDLLELAQRAVSELENLRSACALAPGPAPTPAPATQPAPAPLLGNWPIIVGIDLTGLLASIHTTLPLSQLLEEAVKLKDRDKTPLKLDAKTTKHIDITTNTENDALVQQISTMLKALLKISDDESTRCAAAADVLGINQGAAIGMYTIGNVTAAHGHCMGVLNILLGGTKTWRFWRPGFKHPSKDSKEDERIEQLPGQLLWLPPGWYHEVHTTGMSCNAVIPFRNVQGVAYSFTCWHVPSESFARAIAAFACGVSVESQYDGRAPTTAKGKLMYAALYDIFVESPAKVL